MITELISNVFGAVKEFFGWKREADVRENTPEQQANAKSADDAKIVDDARKDIKEGTIDDIRRDLS